MSSTLLEKVASIPKEREKEVEAYLDSILEEAKKSSEQDKVKRPRFGSGKGTFIMSPDFDEPLDELKDYM